MFKRNFSKFFFLTILFLICAGECRFWEKPETETPESAPFVAREIPSDIPFSTKEPNIYQAEMVITVEKNGEKFEDKTRLARNGGALRRDYRFREKNQVSFLQIDAGSSFLIFQDQKIYTQDAGGETNFAQNSDDFLTDFWLNQNRAAKFESLGTENGLAKYRTAADGEENKNSETIIYVDMDFQIPVRQEFYSLNDGQKSLVFTFELRNLKLETEAGLFEIPKHYKKVSSKEFRLVLQREKTNGE